jgi:hypothetical protein
MMSCVSIRKTCEDNTNLYKLDLLWKERMTLPFWCLLTEDVFIKICKHVDDRFEVPSIRCMKYDYFQNIKDIEYEAPAPNNIHEREAMTYEELLALRSNHIPKNNDILSPSTNIIKPQCGDLQKTYETYVNYSEEIKKDMLPTDEGEFHLLESIIHTSPYLKKIFG